MTTQRWPRTHERTNARDTVKREPAAEPKPWLTRRSVRNAPAPTALRVEPWDSEILRTLTDNACKDCGHVRCSCPEQAIKRDDGNCVYCERGDASAPCSTVAAGPPKPEPAPKAGEREVPHVGHEVRVGDVWRLTLPSGGDSYDWRVLETCDDPNHGPMCERLRDGARQRTSVCERGRVGTFWSLVSRAQPDAVDDGAAGIALLASLKPPSWVSEFDDSCIASVVGSGRLRVSIHGTTWYALRAGIEHTFTNPLDALLWCYGFHVMPPSPANYCVRWQNATGANVYQRVDRLAFAVSLHGEAAAFRGVPWWEAVAEALGKSPGELGIARGPVPT